MITSSNTPAPAVNYLNAHLEGLGYLNSLEKVMPKPGDSFTPFWSAKFCLLEGHPAHPDKIPVDLKIPADKALNELLPFLASINDPDVKVWVGLRLATYRAKPFVYGPESQFVGQLGICYTADLISVLHLKIGDRTIDLKRNEKVTTTDLGVPAAASAKNAQLLSGVWPVTVKLDKNEPNFEVTKQRLKDEGYRWAGLLTAWVVPSVKLEPNHPHFSARMAELQKLGYTWNGEIGTWDYPFAKSRAASGQGNYRANQSQFAQSSAFQSRH